MAARPLVPPPLALAGFALIIWELAGLTPSLSIDYPLRWPLALAVGALGLAFLTAGIATIMLARTTVNPLTPGKATHLVTHGVYRLSRNPIYVGDVLLLTAFAFWLGNPLALPFPPLLLLWLHRMQIAPEEAALAAKFGAEFDDYRKKVRRWL
jgi:protein-S-isoprenylcysteine O-methyltransferase Ste14